MYETLQPTRSNDTHRRIIKCSKRGLWSYSEWKFSERAQCYQEGYGYHWFKTPEEITTYFDLSKPEIGDRDLDTPTIGYPNEVYYSSRIVLTERK